MDEKKMFPVGAVLSVITGKFLARDMSELYEILSHLTGDQVMTHQIPRAVQTAQPYIRAEYPELARVELPQDITPQWMQEMKRTFGARLPVAPLPAGVWEQRNPLAELADMMTDRRSD